jgi:hypothetical protein
MKFSWLDPVRINFHALSVGSKVPVPVVVLEQTLEEFSMLSDPQVE